MRLQNLLTQLIRSSAGGPPVGGAGQGVTELPSEETRRKFEQWWSLQQARIVRPPISWYSSPPPQLHERKPLEKPAENHVHPALQVSLILQTEKH